MSVPTQDTDVIGASDGVKSTSERSLRSLLLSAANSTDTDFCYADPFHRYSQSKSKVVKNHTKFWSFFGLPNFAGAAIPKVVPTLSCHLFCEVTHTDPKGIGTYKLNFKPNLKYSPLKFFYGTPSPFVVS